MKRKCARCDNMFKKTHFVVCGNCLTDLDRLNRGLPAVNYTPVKGNSGKINPKRA